MHVVADHLRAVSFLIADGLLPSNEGAGYVLRRILRRAVRFGKDLGFDRPFLSDLLPTLVGIMGDAYPVIREKEAFIAKALKGEEEKFFVTLEKGLIILNGELEKIKKGKDLSGATAFLLYDTFGFPLDLTQVIASERGFGVDEKGFQSCMAKQKSQSRGTDQAENAGSNPLYKQLFDEGLQCTFLGYDSTEQEGTLLALLAKDGRTDSVVAKKSSESFEAIFAKTPFYGESGGQAGDIGRLVENGQTIAKIEGAKKISGELTIISGTLLPGNTLSVGTSYGQEVPKMFRQLVASSHSATHLLHWALREVLGDHVKQAGSLVNDEGLRFDFTHFQALTESELTKIENMVNEKIANNDAVEVDIMSKDEAISAGAIALFGEKYGDKVRVLRMGEYSTELCGGTHVQKTGAIRLFTIISEQGIAAGTRRITALVHSPAFRHLREKAAAIDSLRSKLRVKNESEVLTRVEKMQTTVRELEKRLEKMELKSAAHLAKEIVHQAKMCSNVQVVTHTLDGTVQSIRNSFRTDATAPAFGCNCTRSARQWKSIPVDLYFQGLNRPTPRWKNGPRNRT